MTITITVLMRGATETEFFHRAGMEDTKLGASENKVQAAEVAKDGFEALISGKDRVVAGSFKNKVRVGAVIQEDACMALDRDRLFKPVKKLRKLIGRIDSKSSPKKVHDLRTNIRRFEATFEALALEAHGVHKKMLKDLRRLRKRAGKVRDMDVLTRFASTIHTREDEECGVQLLEHLVAQRKKQAEKLSAEGSGLQSSLRKELKRTASVLAKLPKENEDATNGSQGSADAVANAVKLAAQLGIPKHLGRTTLHPYRLKVKELRNVLRLASNASRSRFIDELGGVKDAIGEWHDWEELVSIAERVLVHRTGCEVRAELKRIAAQKYEQALERAQQLRKAYLQNMRSPQKGGAAAYPKSPGPPVWEAASRLTA